MVASISWDDLYPFMDEVKVMARTLLQLERQAALQTTELVLTALRRQRRIDQGWSQVTWQNRQYFFGAVYQAMRRALIDHARQRAAGKRRAERLLQPEDIQLFDLRQTLAREPLQIVALVEALTWLEQEAPPFAQVIEHRFYGGLTLEEIAQLLEVDERTVRRRWHRARLLLFERILHRVNADSSAP